MKEHENILVFCAGQTVFNQELKRLSRPISSWRKNGKGGNLLREVKTGRDRLQEETGFASSLIYCDNEHNGEAHPTQKPVDLYRYLVRTYTNPSEVVLDITMGSGTTGIACVQEGREFIGIEKELSYFSIAESRLKEAVLQPNFFTPSNNRLQWTGGESPALPGFSTPEV